MSTVTVETIINIEVEQSDGAVIMLTLTLDDARALKDELIRAVGAQNPAGYAPVLRPVGGFGNDTGPADHVMANGHKIPEHLLKRAQAARDKNKPRCHCGDAGWGENGCCGTSGCNNVPG